jgi:hypothetical protein
VFLDHWRAESDADAKRLAGKPSGDLSHFIGREPERRIFSRYLVLEVGAVPRLPVLMFFRVGGTGKTWLLKKLQNGISGPFSTMPSMRGDFTKEGDVCLHDENFYHPKHLGMLTDLRCCSL